MFPSHDQNEAPNLAESSYGLYFSLDIPIAAFGKPGLKSDTLLDVLGRLQSDFEANSTGYINSPAETDDSSDTSSDNPSEGQ